MNKRYFVFGSNKSGIHGAGAAKFAFENKGAKWRVGEGITGQSYALPTKGYEIEHMSLDEIRPHMATFIHSAKVLKYDIFELTPIGCGLAGHTREDMILMIDGITGGLPPPSNILFTREWFFY